MARETAPPPVSAGFNLRTAAAGALGIAVKDVILQGAVGLRWAHYDLWAILARGYPAVSSTAVAAIGFALHLAIGVLWALLWALLWTLLWPLSSASPRSPSHAGNQVPAWSLAALVNTAVIWTGWGISFSLFRLGPAPWAFDFPTTVITLLSDLGYSLVTAWGIHLTVSRANIG